MEKLENKTYTSKIQQGYDVNEGYYYFVELPQELLDNLGWVENDRLNAQVKLGEVGNVIVVRKI